MTHYLIDTHVHFYPCYDENLFFDHAAANFSKVVQQNNLHDPSVGCLFFTETSQDHYFRKFREETASPSSGQWTFRPTSEDYSLIAEKKGAPKLVLIAGRQIVTSEGLEVLALGCDAEFTEGLPLQDVVEEVRKAEAITVLPWGFGKWSSKRKKFLQDFFKHSQDTGIFLGDSSQRASFLAGPSKLGAGRKILRGSDPLPFSSDVRRAGSYGCILRGEVDMEKPGDGLKRLIYASALDEGGYGKPVDFFSFFCNQIKMQIRKRVG